MESDAEQAIKRSLRATKGVPTREKNASAKACVRAGLKPPAASGGEAHGLLQAGRLTMAAKADKATLVEASRRAR
jgi:hypothetical protein